MVLSVAVQKWGGGILKYIQLVDVHRKSVRDEFCVFLSTRPFFYWLCSLSKKKCQSLSSFGFFTHMCAVRSANPLANLHSFCSIVQLHSVKIDKVQFRVQILSSVVLFWSQRIAAMWETRSGVWIKGLILFSSTLLSWPSV